MKRWLIIALIAASTLMGSLAGCGQSEVAISPEEESSSGGVIPPTSEEEATLPDKTEKYETPKAGDWTIVSTGSSEFNISGFTVNPDGTGITKIIYNFVKFQCMGVTISGGVESSRVPMWHITGNQLTINLTERIQYGSDWDIIIEGSFDNTGTHASGTWEISSTGAICQKGAWEASAP